MTFFEAFLYGAVQGLTEYLPVSSSAHLALLPRFLGKADPGLSFDVFLHAGTLGSTLIYFRKEWMGLLRSFLKPEGQRIVWNVIFATLPALVVGGLFSDWIGIHLRGPRLIASALILGGVLLYLSDRYSRGVRSWTEMRRLDAWAVGFFQCLAFIPGMSRSGSTIMGARFLGLSREAAARFSFFVSAPVTAAALASELRHWDKIMQSVSTASSVGTTAHAWLILATGALSAFVFGWIAISGLIRLVSRTGFAAFAVYRIVLAAIVLLYLGSS
ncbi:MAG: undecaprenyl-diphosphate phosphatase [Bdellovibrionales bacterium]|nr:undecaprenyl-diphosphate phosphatase [Bdellovibrionales bacterium]